MRMQPNPGWGIIVNVRTIPYIAFEKATICLYFPEGELLDLQTTLDNLVEGMKSGFSGTRIRDISSGGAELVKTGVGVMRSFGGSWKPVFSSAKISEQMRFVPILTGQIGGIWGFWSSTNERHDPFPTTALYATLDVVWTQNKVRTLHRLEFVMMSHTGVSRRRDALIIGNNSCGAPFLWARLISPIRLPRGMFFFKSYFSLTSLLILFPLRSTLSKSLFSAFHSRLTYKCRPAQNGADMCY